MIKPCQEIFAASCCLPACNSVHRHSARQVPTPLSYPRYPALWGYQAQWSLGSLGPRAEEVLSTQLLTPPSSAVICWYLMALDGPSSHLSAVLRAVWSREAVVAPVVSGVRPENMNSPLFACSDPDTFIPLAVSPSKLFSPSWPQRKWLNLTQKQAVCFLIFKPCYLNSS